MPFTQNKAQFQVIFDNGGDALLNSHILFLRIPFDCRIVGAMAISDQSGSGEFSIYKVDSSNALSESIGSFSVSDVQEDADVSSWNKDLTEGDIIAMRTAGEFDFTSITKSSLILIVEKV